MDRKIKIGILTQPLHVNYGGLLQNYALQTILRDAGYEAETIRWEQKFGFRSFLYRIKMQVFHLLYPAKYPKLLYQLNKREVDIIRTNTRHFVDTYIAHTEAAHSYNDFLRLSGDGRYDVYIVGSDQCWRPCYNPFLTSMFLDFVQEKEVQRIAYAASFGTDVWELSAQQTEICAALAKKFNLITVREDSGVALCKDYLGVDATHVLDPTMLLSKTDYVDLVKKENEPKAIGTLFCYILDPNKSKNAFIQRVSKQAGLKSFQVLPKYQSRIRTRQNVKKHIDDCVYPKVTAWLRAFMDAEMVVVDSFHGVVFSIIFNKPFWVIGNKERGLSRFSSLLRMFRLEERLLDENELDNVDINSSIDWENVNAVLTIKRNESIKLLLKTLNSHERH